MKRILIVVALLASAAIAHADTQDLVVGSSAVKILSESSTRSALSIQNLNASNGVVCSQTDPNVTNDTFQLAASATVSRDSTASYPLYCKSSAGAFVRLTYSFTTPTMSSVTTWYRPTDTTNITAGSMNVLGGSLANTMVDGLYGAAILSGGNSTTGGACTGSCKNEISNAGADISIIAGGYDNVIGGTYTNIAGTIVGGGHNTLDQAGGHGFIGGGSSNTCSGTPDGYCSIPGGTQNTINGNVGTIAGGQNNSQGAGADFGAIGGGANNAINASVDYGTITGGLDNTVSKNFATAIGRKVAARYYGGVSQASGQIAAQGDAQTSVVVMRGTTTDATVDVNLFADGAVEKVTIPSNTTVGYRVMVVGRNTTDTTSGVYECAGAIKNNAGTTTFVASGTNADVTCTALTAIGAATVEIGITDSTTDTMNVEITGIAGKTILWVARIELVEVTG